MANKLYIFCGIPFSGKSTLAKELAKRKGYTRIDLDEVKFDLYGKGVSDQDLQQRDWDIIYQAMYRRVEGALRSGKTVIQDAGNFTKYERGLVRQISDKLGIEAITVYVDTAKALAKERLITNRTTNHRFDVTDKEFEDAVSEMETPEADELTITYVSGAPVEAWIKEYFTREKS